MSNLSSGATAPGPVQSGTGAPTQPSNTNTFGVYASSLNGSTANQGASGTAPAPAAAPTSAPSQTEAPPGAAVSAYEYQTYIAGASLILGPQLASVLGLSSNSPVTGSQVINAFYGLSQGELRSLEESLYYAGMYANAAGEQTTTRPDFGVADIDGFNALSQAILQAANGKSAGETLSGYLANRISSGAGQAAIQGAIQPITGGGNVYQVNLTSPTDVYATAMQIFQQYLGRNPTQTELDNIVQQVQSQQTQYQQTLNTQAESAKQAQYQQAINSRTAQLTPAVPNGPIPNGPYENPGQYSVAFLQYLGYPVTASNVSVLTAWINANGGLNGLGRNNPLGVSTAGPGVTPAAKASNFATPAQGMQAAANLLNSPQYYNLSSALATGQGATYATSSGVKDELSQWSGGKITSLNTAAQQSAAEAAVTNYTTPDISRGQAPGFMGPLPSSGTGGPVQTTRAEAPNFMGPLPSTPMGGGQPSSASPSMVQPQQASPGQGLTAPGDSYLPASTLTATAPPSPTSVATQAATTGANLTPYLGNQFLQAYQSILSLIQGGYK